MSVPVALDVLAEVIGARGPEAFLVTAGASPQPHLKHIRVRVERDRLVCASGGGARRNVSVSPTAVLLWPAPPQRGHSLLVDGRAAVLDSELVVEPTNAMLHRPPWLSAAEPPPLPVHGAVPAGSWESGPPDDDVDATGLAGLADLLMASDRTGPTGITRALLAVHRGRIVSERYGPDTGPETPLLSWSMAKSVLHTALGVLVRDGRLDPEEPAPVEAWREAGDPRREITVRHLLEMRDGLAWNEDYTDGGSSDVIEMLFGEGHTDVAAFAAGRPPAHEPDTTFNYSSGSSNILAGVLASVLAGPSGGPDRGPAERGGHVRDFLATEVFAPIGMTSATADLDPSGTWVASSAVHATARDWARFGLLQLRGGSWAGRVVVEHPWVDAARRPRSWDPVDDVGYGRHWWTVPDRHGSFVAAGYEGQYLQVVPALDLVLVRLGVTPTEKDPVLRARLAEVVECFSP